MRLAQDRGIVKISVDVPEHACPQSAVNRKGSVRFIERAVKLFDEYELPATWGFDPLGSSELLASVLARRQDHELALIANSSWLCREQAGWITPSWLRRRIASAAELNVPISSVLLRDSVLPSELGPLARHGILAIRGRSLPSSSSPTPCLPQRLRYGIWFEPSNLVIPHINHRPHLLAGNPLKRAMRRVRRTGADYELTHIVVDFPALVQNGSFALQQLDHVIRAVAECRDRGNLGVLTLTASARHHLKNLKTSPAHSVLRPAA